MVNLKNNLVQQGRGESGLTLVELLVAVGIIVSLAAIIGPSVIKWASEGEEAALGGEWDAVQGAIDVMMADQRLIAITDGTAEQIFFNTDLGGGPMSGYMRDAETKYCYTWDDDGNVTAQAPC